MNSLAINLFIVALAAPPEDAAARHACSPPVRAFERVSDVLADRTGIAHERAVTSGQGNSVTTAQLIEMLGDIDSNLSLRAAETLRHRGKHVEASLRAHYPVAGLATRDVIADILFDLYACDTESLLGAIQDDIQEVRLRAGWAVARKSPSIIPELLDLLSSNGDPLRESVAGALDKMAIVKPQEEIQKEFRRLIAGKHDDVARQLAKLLLADVPKAQFARRVEAISSSSEPVRWLAARQLGESAFAVSDNRVVPHLLRALEDPSADVRCSAVRALAGVAYTRRGAREVIGSLARCLDDPSTRHVACESLAAFGDTGSVAIRSLESVEAFRNSAHVLVPLLIAALADERQEVRCAAAWTLAQFGPAAHQAIVPLVQALADRSRGVSWSAGMALAKIGNEAIPALLAALANEDASVRAEAADALSQIGPISSEAAECLRKAMKDDCHLVRLHAVTGLKRMPASVANALPELTLAIGDQSELVRLQAARAIGDYGARARDAVPRLLTLLLDDNPKIRGAAAESLGRLAPAARDAIPLLMEASKDADEEVREKALHALSRLNNEEVRHLLHRQPVCRCRKLHGHRHAHRYRRCRALRVQ